MDNNFTITLRDIKPLVQIEDYSLYLFSGIILLVLVIVLVLLYRYLTRVRKTVQLSPQHIALNRLRNINYDDTKETVYTFSIDGYLFVNDTNKELYQSIQKELERFKYKKIVEALPIDLKEKIKVFVKDIK